MNSQINKVFIIFLIAILIIGISIVSYRYFRIGVFKSYQIEKSETKNNNLTSSTPSTIDQNLIKNGFVLMNDDGTIVKEETMASELGNIKTLILDKELIVKKFLHDNPGAENIYDFIVIVTSFKPGNYVGQFMATKPGINGIGDANEDINLPNTLNKIGLTGKEKLQGYAFVMDLDSILSGNLRIIVHEISHRWLFRLGDYDTCGKGFGCTKETGFKINKDGSHYNDKISTINKEGLEWYIDPNGGGSFIPSPTQGYCLSVGANKYRFTSMSLYLMGLISAEQTVPLKWYETSGSWSDKGIKCIEKSFSVNDIIKMVGPRNPSYPNTQRKFSVAFILFNKKDQPANDIQINKMKLIVDQFPSRWYDATNHLSEIISPH